MRWVVLLAISFTSGGCGPLAMLGLGVGNAHHMTVERALAEKVDTRFRVLDAETRKPVANATVVLVHNFDWKDDWVVDATGGADGIVTVRTAQDPTYANVGAPGYLTRGPLYFSENLKEPGVGQLSNDPVEVYLYKTPGPSWGLRVPDGFEGEVIYRHGHSSEPIRFPFPPDFPAGQRVWWTEFETGSEAVLPPYPPLGIDTGAGGQPLQLCIAYESGRLIPMPAPGAEATGIAAWHIGTLQPRGPWDITKQVVVVGSRDAALQTAKRMYAEHGNGRTGWILNGWLKIVSPETKLTNNSPYSVTRSKLGR